VTDWDKRSILTLDVSSSSPTLTEVIGDVALPMSVQYSITSGMTSNASFYLPSICFLNPLTLTDPWRHSPISAYLQIRFLARDARATLLILSQCCFISQCY